MRNIHLRLFTSVPLYLFRGMNITANVHRKWLVNTISSKLNVMLYGWKQWQLRITQSANCISLIVDSPRVWSRHITCRASRISFLSYMWNRFMNKKDPRCVNMFDRVLHRLSISIKEITHIGFIKFYYITFWIYILLTLLHQ